jgi:hypothetical protein
VGYESMDFLGPVLLVKTESRLGNILLALIEKVARILES